MRRFRALVMLMPLAIAVMDSQVAEATPQVVVLRNGNVLQGSVEPMGDFVRVTSQGGEVRLRATDVDLQSESLEVAYRQLRARISPDTAAGHLQLAAWCIRLELWDAAQRELADARRLEPDHPRLVLLEQTAVHLRRLAKNEPKAPGRAASESVRPADQPGDVAAPPSDMLAQLPEGALEDFTRRVQPVLVNNCTTSGCHRMGGPQSFQLNRDLLHGMANRRSTLRNLTATLGVVNADAPLESELLEQATAPHGGMQAPPLPIHQPELRKRLEEWMLLASGKTPPESAPSSGAVQLAGGAVDGTGVAVPAGGAPQASDEQSMIAADLEMEALLAPVQPKPPRVGVQLRAWAPRDEFDPEIFNRMQAKPREEAAPDTIEQ